MIYRDCYFAHFAASPCDGRLDRCHIIRQQDIRKEWALANPRIPTAWIPATDLTGTDLDALLADERNIVGGCRHHHHQADGGFLSYAPPTEAYLFADAFGLLHYLPAMEAAA